MMNDWFASSRTEFAFLLPLVDLITKVSILLVLACAIHAILGRRRVLIRSGLWNALLLATLLLPTANLVLPRFRVAWLSVLESPADARQSLALPVINDPPGGSLHDGGRARETIAPASFEPAEPPRPDSWRPSKSPSDLSLPLGVLGGIYAVGVMFLSVRLGASFKAVATLKRHAREVDNPAWTVPLSQWRNRLGISRSVTLVHSDHVRVPLLLGWLQPMIVISCEDDDTTALAAAQVDAILLHELAHLRRGDDVWNLVQQVVQILYWPHPLIWWAARLIGGVREQACDDLCVRWAGGADPYRAALVAVASRLVRGRTSSVPISLGLAIARASSSALLRRLSWIDQTGGAAAPMLCWPGRLTIAMLVIGAAFLLSTIELTRARAAQVAVAKVPGDHSPLVRAYNQPLPNTARFHTVTLTVVDDETNQPLADAEVIVLNYVDLQDYPFKTDSRGRLRFEYPYVGAKPMLNIELRKNGYVPLRHAWGSETGSSPVVDDLAIRLRRGSTMGGIVVYVRDQPVEGVTVVMTVRKYGPGKRPDNPTGYEIYYEVPSRTGPDGRWRTDSVPPGAEEVHLQLIHPDFVSDGCTTVGAKGRSPKVADLRDQTDRQVLLKGVKISGRVLDAQGQPIEGAQVVDSTGGFAFLTYIRRAFTDAEGRFHFHLPRGGDVSLCAQARGSGPVTLKVPAEPDSPPIEFRLTSGHTLRARIVDPQGKPIAGVNIIIPNIGKHAGVFFRRWSDTEGRFDWDSAPEESVVYSVYADGYIGRDRVPLVASDKEAIVVLKPAIDVKLRVVDAAAGEPIARFSVQTGAAMKGSQDFLWGPASIGVFKGDYRTSLDAAKGPYQLKIYAFGYAKAQTRTFRVDERAVQEVVKLNKEKP